MNAKILIIIIIDKADQETSERKALKVIQRNIQIIHSNMFRLSPVLPVADLFISEEYLKITQGNMNSQFGVTMFIRAFKADIPLKL